jgi:hypothetical protein
MGECELDSYGLGQGPVAGSFKQLLASQEGLSSTELVSSSRTEWCHVKQQRFLQ